LTWSFRLSSQSERLTILGLFCVRYWSLLIV